MEKAIAPKFNASDKDRGKSMASYPHWPLTYQSEAVDQLHCLVGQSYPYLDGFPLGKGHGWHGRRHRNHIPCTKQLSGTPAVGK